MKLRCISNWGSWSGAHPSRKDVHKCLGKRRENITLPKKQSSQQNSTNGTFSLTRLPLWDERSASGARQRQWAGQLHPILQIPAPRSGFPPVPAEATSALSRGHGLGSHHPPHAESTASAAPAGAQSAAFWGYKQGESCSQTIKSRKKYSIKTTKNHCERQMHLT